MNSRSKGKRGELEFASLCRANGYSARRGQQYCGTSGDADVVGLPGVHIEVKRNERLNLYDAISQSCRDAREGELPIVAHRKNNCNWLVSMPEEVFFEIYREWESGQNDE